MKADDSNVTELFAHQIGQYCIPHYQRPQAWRVDKHWEPLWADVEGKANDWLNEVTPKPHYLGAVVLAKRQKIGVRGIDRLLVIDGQQRLSTLQYLLKALSLVTDELEYEDGSLSIREELYNTNETMMDRPDVQRHKLWPTFRDRDAHRLVMRANSIVALRDQFPNNFTKSGKLYVNYQHPRPLEATWFFYHKILLWIEDLAGQQEKTNGIEAVRKAITTSLQFIILWLEETDDPQVIFECLNGRGEPLRSTDLIKNFIFMAAETSAKDSSDDFTEESPLYKLWSKFDEPVWSEGVTRGRLTRTRLEWLIYYCLQAETGQDLDISRSYESYQKWAAPKNTNRLAASEQIDILLDYATHLQTFIAEDPSLPIGRFGKIAQSLDVTTVSAVSLAIAKNCDPSTQVEMFDCLASYLVRRETCGLTKKAYNVIFLALLKELRRGGFNLETLKNHLGSLNGDASLWPDDARFARDVATRKIYGSGSALNICRLLLATAAARIGASHASEVQWSPDWTHLHVEHLMPQAWFEYWPLPDGTLASPEEALNAPLTSDENSDAARRINVIQRREQLKNTLGNLTVLNKAINMKIKHYAWPIKREEVREVTQLRMNFDLVSEPIWNEDRIRERGLSLAQLLATVWQSPPLKEAIAAQAGI